MISVIVCAYNEESHIEKCLLSLVSQNLDRSLFNILVIDNSSEDATYSIVHSFITKACPNDVAIRLISIEHVDLSSSRNTGILECNSPYILFVDADAYVESDFLQNYFDAINQNPLSDILHGPVLNSNNHDFTKFYFRAHMQASQKMSKTHSVIGANMMFKASVFNYGYFFSELKRGDESGLIAHLEANGTYLKYTFVERAKVFNWYPSSLSGWYGIIFTEGSMRALIDYRITRLTYFHVLRNLVLRLIMPITVLFLCLYVMGVTYLSDKLFFGFSFVASLRLFFVRKYLSFGLTFQKSRTTLRTLFLICNFPTVFLLRDTGYVVGLLRLIFRRRVPCTVRTSKILSRVDGANVE